MTRLRITGELSSDRQARASGSGEAQSPGQKPEPNPPIVKVCEPTKPKPGSSKCVVTVWTPAASECGGRIQYTVKNQKPDVEFHLFAVLCTGSGWPSWSKLMLAALR